LIVIEKTKLYFFKIKKEKSIMYYSGWGKGKPVNEEKSEKQTKLK